MKSSRTCLRCWKPGLILASKLLVCSIVSWFLRCLIWLVYFMSFYLIMLIFVFFLARPIWFDEESLEGHTHITPGYISEKVSQELGWDN
ncbi:hypothetical protein F5Y07DRAFT_393169 [Xylaria sp. FL0933]|nr:hypothetical protein F5Y07DRAFT_393169 [Xylaria sp. FL0933]